jgi:hypothetical protein
MGQRTGGSNKKGIGSATGSAWHSVQRFDHDLTSPTPLLRVHSWSYSVVARAVYRNSRIAAGASRDRFLI